MTSLHRSILASAVVVAAIWTASPASAQETARTTPAPASKAASQINTDSIPVKAVEQAAQELAIAVQEAVRKASEDPAVKLAALSVAKNAVSAAQVVLTQQAETLQMVLDRLAREIAQATVTHQSKTKSH